jgi:hypothetical protein
MSAASADFDAELNSVENELDMLMGLEDPTDEQIALLESKLRRLSEPPSPAVSSPEKTPPRKPALSGRVPLTTRPSLADKIAEAEVRLAELASSDDPPEDELANLEAELAQLMNQAAEESENA